ncbi:MAG: 7-cyano-7-deazaguanine synthase QueC [Elusimicrobia bacterium RIFOXYD2_FULL_34_15]|nr:MAG: 7-cyano-7-deazaguanine synthase QueC [Elusimicrobia bacterium RIFOXYD2_FULL_34_15]
MKNKAIVLLSGGLDSTTTLYLVKNKYKCFCLIFDYGQRHRKEIENAKNVAKTAGCKYNVVKIFLPWKGSSLIDKNKKIPYNKSGSIGGKIPSTYVPGRNTIFLSYALSFAEAIGARKIFIGANSLDFSGYPDCRPKYFRNFNRVFKIGTRNKNIKIETPIIYKTKKDIVKLGTKHKVPFELTWSCYSGGKHPCGKCDSCILRAKGFKEAGEEDPVS